MFFACMQSAVRVEGNAPPKGDPKPFIQACEAQDVTALALLKAIEETNCSKGWERLSRAERIDLTPLDNSPLGALSGMVNLKALTAYGNEISDLTPLKGLIRMEELYLVSNKIEDLSPLEDMTQLRFLRVDGNKIKDISVIQHFNHLEMIGFDQNEISDFRPLEKFELLQGLNTNFNPVDLRTCPVSGKGPPQLHKYCKRMRKNEGLPELGELPSEYKGPSQ